MDNRSRKVLADALELSPKKRAGLVEEILSSFDAGGREAIDAAWAAEAEDRIDAYEKGELPASSIDAVFRRLESRER